MQRPMLGSLRLSLSLCALIFAISGRAEAGLTVVTFDNLADGTVPDGYGGINWSGDWYNYTEAQPPYNPESPPGRVYTYSGTAPMTFVTPGQVFDGAYFSGYSFATVQFELLYNSVPVAYSAVLAPSATPTFLSSGYSGPVDQVLVLSPSPDYYVMDNVTYGTAVPEPSAIVMGGTALVITGLVLRLRRRS